MARILQDVIDRLSRLEKKTETLERGVYGDSKNEIKGLIRNISELRESVEEIQSKLEILLETLQNQPVRNKSINWKKISYIIAGLSTIGGACWKIYQWINALN